MLAFILPLAVKIFLGIGITIVLAVVISKIVIQMEIRAKYRNAVRAIVKNKNVKTIKVGIYDDDNRMIDEVKFKSALGVSDSLSVGETIFIN